MKRKKSALKKEKGPLCGPTMILGGSRADLFPDRNFLGRFLPAQNAAWWTCFPTAEQRSEEKSRMSCRQAFRRRYVAIAREAVGAVPATMFRPALAGRMIGATLILRTFGSRARNFPRRRFRARRSPWWTLWTGLGAAGCPQVHRGRGLRLKKKEAEASFSCAAVSI